MLSRVYTWIRIRLIQWGRLSDLMWYNNIPKNNRFEITDDLELKKDLKYWETIANIAENLPFLNEMQVMQKKYSSRINRELSQVEPNYKKVKHFTDMLSGIKMAAKIVADAHIATIKIKEG